MSTQAIAGAIRESAASRTPLRISGRSNWLDAGRPVRAGKSLSLRDDTGVVGYVPGDLTLTVRAGTTLDEIERVTLEHDQWLPLDPYGSSSGTIGATMSTASAGPLAGTFGLPRDLLLGLEFVNGRGDVVRAGGKVVKNVAGFDLSRLLTGSWGTLGVITEVTLRLYARPRADRSFVITLNRAEQQTKALAQAAYTSLSPFALMFVSASAARRLDLGENPACLIRLGGNDAVVAEQLGALSQIARPEAVESGVWSALRDLDTNADSVIRISNLPVQFLGASPRILGDDVRGIYTSIDPRRGVMRVVVGGNGEATDAGSPANGASLDFAGDGGSSRVIFEKLPADIWSQVSPSVVSDRLSQGIKKAYDPHNILNPGILGDLQ